MGFMCDFCGAQKSMVYCRSDAACLCLSCDRNVHSANALSKRHTRTLLCEKCHTQPAVARCIDERISLCQNCDWRAMAHLPQLHRHTRDKPLIATLVVHQLQNFLPSGPLFWMFPLEMMLVRQSWD